MTRRYYSSSAADTTLSSSVSSSATSITVGSVTGHPVQYPYTLILDPETASEEVTTVTGGTGTNLTVIRGVDGTTGLAHTAGAVVRHGVSARDYDEPNDHVNSSDAVHGITGDVVGTTDTQTLTGKTISVDDNDITGLAASSFVVTDASGVVDGAAAAKAVPTGTVVGTTDTQTLSNKTLSSPVIDSPDITGIVMPKVVTSGAASLSASDGNGNRSITVGTSIPDGAIIVAWFVDGSSNRVHLVPSHHNGTSLYFDPDNQSTSGQGWGTGTTINYRVYGDA